MNKTFFILFLSLLMLATIVFARPMDNGWKSQIGRHDDRSCVYDIKPWGYKVMGVMGRMSDGSYSCIVPSSRPRSTTSPDVGISNPIITPPEPPIEPVCHFETRNVCEDKTCCHQECDREKVWKRTCWKDKHHKEHCNNGWVWEKVCKEVCKTHRVCHDEKIKVCEE